MENPKLQASVGLAFSMGCFMAVFALLALLAGVWIDRTFLSGSRIAIAACVLGSIPFNLFIALRLTQVILKRIIPPDERKSGKTPITAPDQADQ
jgi:hypothetical protein